MTCQRIKTRPMSLYEAMEAFGSKHGWGPPDNKPRTKQQLVDLQKEQERVEKETIIPGGEFFLHGDFDPFAVCRCGYESDRLCDYPMGKGETCDAPLCQDCAVCIGKDLDLCRVHHTMWRDAPRIHLIPGGAR